MNATPQHQNAKMTKGASQGNTNAHRPNCRHIARTISGKSTKNANYPVIILQENAKTENVQQVNTFAENQKTKDFPMRHTLAERVTGSITTLVLGSATNRLENATVSQ